MTAEALMDNGWTLGLPWLAAAAAASWAAGVAWRRVVVPLVERTEGDLDDRVAAAVRRPVQLLVGALVMQSAAAQLKLRPDVGGSRLFPYLHGLFMSATVIAVAWVASAVVEEIAAWTLERAGRDSEARLDRQVMPMLRRLVRLVAGFVAATIILGAYDVKITALLGAAGVASLAVALASQETVANMIGGLTIMVDRPFRVGDWIELNDGRAGDVIQVGIRSTRLLTYDRTVHILPNAELMKQPITNHAFPDRSVTVRQTVGVAYGCDVGRAKAAIRGAAAASTGVLPDPAPAAHLAAFGDSSLNLTLQYTVADYRERWAVADAVNTEILRRLAAEGIAMPFPTRTVHLARDGS